MSVYICCHCGMCSHGRLYQEKDPRIRHKSHFLHFSLLLSLPTSYCLFFSSSCFSLCTTHTCSWLSLQTSFFFFCSLPKTGKHDFIHNPPTVESVKSLVMKRCGHLRPVGLSCIRLAHTKVLRCRLCGLCVSSTASG